MYHDEIKSNRIINFIERVCTHVKGDLANNHSYWKNGKKNISGQLFGTMNDNGQRVNTARRMCRFRERMENRICWRPLALAMLFVEKEQGAEIYCCASSRDQANANLSMCVNRWSGIQTSVDQRVARCSEIPSY
jgi:hypothetical protein